MKRNRKVVPSKLSRTFSTSQELQVINFETNCESGLLSSWNKIYHINSSNRTFIETGMSEYLYKKCLRSRRQNLIYFHFQERKSSIHIYRTRLKSNMRDICNFGDFLCVSDSKYEQLKECQSSFPHNIQKIYAFFYSNINFTTFIEI